MGFRVLRKRCSHSEVIKTHDTLPVLMARIKGVVELDSSATTRKCELNKQGALVARKDDNQQQNRDKDRQESGEGFHRGHRVPMNYKLRVEGIYTLHSLGSHWATPQGGQHFIREPLGASHVLGDAI